jgi:LysM repeat protein
MQLVLLFTFLGLILLNNQHNMKNNTFRILLFSFFVCYSAAQSVAQSTVLLTTKDSVFMFVHEQNQKLLMHPVKKAQTLYSIAKFYGISTEELMAYNPWYKDDASITAKDKVLVPIPNKAINRYVKKDKLKGYTRLYYVVQKGDNLYSISKKYFDMPVEEVKQRNKLTTETIELGQLLHVGWIPVSGIPKEWRSQTTQQSSSVTTSKGVKETTPVSFKKHKAMWANDKKTVTGNFCLTNEAPKNSIVIVSNPINNKSVEVTVVGKLNISKDPTVKIFLSEQAATSLGLTAKENTVTIEAKK